MSRDDALQNSYGPEVTPYQTATQPPPEAYRGPPRYEGGLEKTPEASPNTPSPGSGPVELAAAAAAHPHPRRRPICGVPRTIFLVIATVVVLGIVGLAVGLGVGLGVKHNGGDPAPAAASSSGSLSATTNTPTSMPTASASASSSSSATSTSSAGPAVVTSGTHGIAANSCNFKTPKSYTAKDGTIFTQYCFTDWPKNTETADGKGNVTDVSHTTAYTFEDCMEACLKYNSASSASDTKCQAVTYNANLTLSVEVRAKGGNCFLKDKKGVDIQGSAEVASGAIAF